MKAPKSGNLKEAWVLFFFLGVMMINYPFIHIFNKNTMIFGIPALPLYFLLGWPASIAVIFYFCRKLDRVSDSDDSDEGKGEGQG